MKVSKFALSAFVALLVGSSALAQTDTKTRDLLIQKLTQVQVNLAPSDPSRTSITMRLADLHAERARFAAMKELQENCTVCNAGKDDRLKALAYYKDVLNKVPESALPKVMTQIGHLYELVGKESEAVATYEKILREQKAPEAVAEANLSLAEVYFKRRNFSRARDHFKAVVAIPEAGSKGLAAYRVAWCDFNEGRVQPAIDGLVSILKTPALLSRSAAAGVVQVDPQFHEEVSRDLATFLSRKQVSVADGELVYNLSPESAKLANVSYLANEAERIGQVPASIALWRFAGERQSKPQARLEGHVHLANLEMTQKMLPDAIRDFEAALTLWNQIGAKCETAECNELHTRLRNFVIDWNTKEKKAPSAELLAAYRSYLKVFPTEVDMTIWAGKIASDLKDYAGSVSLYNEGARLASEATGEKKKDAADRLESALLGSIESAELSKDPALLNSAYESYLTHSRARTKAVEVRYQKVRLLYDKGDNEAAAQALRELALEKGDHEQIRKQAADLSLDALVQLKDDKRLEAWAADYARAFPKEAKEFSGISRKSILTQSAQIASQDNPEALESAWKTLTRFDLANASQDEKITYYKNKLILAEKLGKFAEARDAVEQLLRMPQLPAADTQYALARKAWLAELILDFDTALTTSEKITTDEFKGDKKWLKLAMFAELAKKDPTPFYNEFLKDSKDGDKNAAIAAQLVRESKEPLREVERKQALLSKNPNLLGDLYLEIYGTNSTPEVAKKALAAPGVAQSPGGKVIARAILLDDIAKLRSKVESHQLDGSNQKKMAATLKGRVALIGDVEKLATRAVESGDWTSQLVALDLLAKQNDRFYQEILSLPVPAGLSPEEEQQYLQLLSQQAAPHKTRASDVSAKVSEFWKNESALANLETAMQNETGGRRRLLTKEIEALKSVAPDDRKEQLQAMTGEKPETAVADGTQGVKPKLTQLEGARQAVRDEPLSRERLERLLRIEKELGHAPMVAYLEGRIGTLPADTTETKKEGVL